NKYHKITFPAAISFYGGKRFVALVVILASAVVGLIAPLIWEPISVGINGLGVVIGNAGAFGVFVFGTLERLLIPTGLHHVLNIAYKEAKKYGQINLAASSEDQNHTYIPT